MVFAIITYVNGQVSTLLDIVKQRFGNSVNSLAIMDCELRWDDIILDVIRDGDVVEAMSSSRTESAHKNSGKDDENGESSHNNHENSSQMVTCFHAATVVPYLYIVIKRHAVLLTVN